MCAVWAFLFAAFYFRITRYVPGTIAIVIGVLSHWLLDQRTQRPKDDEGQSQVFTPSLA